MQNFPINFKLFRFRPVYTDPTESVWRMYYSSVIHDLRALTSRTLMAGKPKFTFHNRRKGWAAKKQIFYNVSSPPRKTRRLSEVTEL